MSSDQSGRRLAQLARLLPLADLHAQAGRARLQGARRAEAEALRALEGLDRQKRETMMRLGREDRPGGDGADPVDLAAQADRWLRWYATQRREALTELARLRAESDTTRQIAGRAIARHEVLRKLKDRAEAARRRDRARRGEG